LTCSEDEFQQAVIELAHAHGWFCAHFRKVRVQRRNGSIYYATPAAADGVGWVDLVLVRDRIVYAELKSERGRLASEQVDWQARLRAAGAEWYCWRPRDWGAIVEVLTR
jgi:hypothetical protein